MMIQEMMIQEVMSLELFNWVIGPFLIFLARVVDVSLGTLRMVFISRGLKEKAAVLGFFEILIWVSVISYVLQQLSGIPTYIGYAGGFAAGNYLGLLLEERLAYGLLLVTVITHRDASQLLSHLNRKEFGITSVEATGSKGRVQMILSIIKRRDTPKFRQIVEQFHPGAFLSVQEVRSVSKALYSDPEWAGMRPFAFDWIRKSK